jgi:hypothetical protein
MLYTVGDRIEPWGTPAPISLGADISPSTKTLNLCCERKELMSLIKLVENSNFDYLYSKPECHVLRFYCKLIAYTRMYNGTYEFWIIKHRVLINMYERILSSKPQKIKMERSKSVPSTILLHNIWAVEFIILVTVCGAPKTYKMNIHKLKLIFQNQTRDYTCKVGVTDIVTCRPITG